MYIASCCHWLEWSSSSPGITDVNRELFWLTKRARGYASPKGVSAAFGWSLEQGWGCFGSRSQVERLAEIKEQGSGLQESDSISLACCCVQRASEWVLPPEAAVEITCGVTNLFSSSCCLQWLRLTKENRKTECDLYFFFLLTFTVCIYSHFILNAEVASQLF